ncbi:unnamed protein product [Amoebophrya sp. A120]|nr:unnamed protein product [Amoebophrya sp. A120]|eukprot:GSA120T00021308001.1
MLGDLLGSNGAANCDGSLPQSAVGNFAQSMTGGPFAAGNKAQPLFPQPGGMGPVPLQPGGGLPQPTLQDQFRAHMATGGAGALGPDQVLPPPEFFAQDHSLSSRPMMNPESTMESAWGAGGAMASRGPLPPSAAVLQQNNALPQHLGAAGAAAAMSSANPMAMQGPAMGGPMMMMPPAMMMPAMAGPMMYNNAYMGGQQHPLQNYHPQSRSITSSNAAHQKSSSSASGSKQQDLRAGDGVTSSGQQASSSSTSTSASSKLLPADPDAGVVTERLSSTRGALEEVGPQGPLVDGNQTTDFSAAEQMVEYLRNSGNPKFATSQFVSFIDKVTKGDLKFTSENTVVDAEGLEIDWDSLYDLEAANQHADSTTANLKNSGGEVQEMIPGNVPEMAGDGLMQADQFTEEMFEEAWRAAEEEMGASMFESAMTADGPPESFMQSLQPQDPGATIWGPGVSQISEYTFMQNNPYLERFPLAADGPAAAGQTVPSPESPMELALKLIAEGKDQEAIQVLEIEVQRNADSSEGWCLLGQLYANLDQDIEAIKCLVKGHEADPYNLDSLLQLGVSCTNELDQVEALRYLYKWVESHEDYGHLVHEKPSSSSKPDAADLLDLSDFEKLRGEVSSLLHSAADSILARAGGTAGEQQSAEANKQEAQVFVALGVVENVSRNFGQAVEALREAVRRSPLDFSIWNKLGATLANSGNSEAAQLCYHQALSLKPNYARTWSNLAIANSNIGHHEDAARFYLSSLVLNPKAEHLWSFVHTAMINIMASSNTTSFTDDRLSTEYLRAAAERDLDKCRKLIPDVLQSKDDLPPRSSQLEQSVEEILAQLPTGEAIAKA